MDPFREPYELPYRLGFDATHLFETAKPGDRLIFLSEEAGQIIYTLPLLP